MHIVIPKTMKLPKVMVSFNCYVRDYWMLCVIQLPLGSPAVRRSDWEGKQVLIFVSELNLCKTKLELINNQFHNNYINFN